MLKCIAYIVTDSAEIVGLAKHRAAAALVFLLASQAPFSGAMATENIPESLVRKLSAECELPINRQKDEKFSECLNRQISIDRSAKSSPSTFSIRFTDYPVKALKEKRSGLSVILLKINEMGRVLSCRISKSSGHVDLDVRACDVSKERGRFLPATDKYGTAIPSTFEYQIHWRFDLEPEYAQKRGGSISDEDYPSKAIREQKSGLATASFSSNELGRVENCRIILSSGSADLDEETCKIITRRWKYRPARDRMGSIIPTDNLQQSINWAMNFASKPSSSDEILDNSVKRCASIGYEVGSEKYQDCLLEQIRLLSR